MRKYVIAMLFLACACSVSAKADITIPVTSGPNPTCLSTLYNQVLTPSGWGPTSDTTAATRFAQSNQGTLGFTIFFEVRPVTSANSSDTSTSNTMNAIGAVALNRQSVSGFVSSRLTGFKAVTKDMSSVWVRTNDGSGDLQATQKAALPVILNGSPTSADCNGLIYALQAGQNVAAELSDAADPGHPTSNNFYVTNNFSQDLWFNSTGNKPSSNAYYLGGTTVPRSGASALYYFYGQNGVALKPGYHWF